MGLYVICVGMYGAVVVVVYCATLCLWLLWYDSFVFYGLTF